MAPLVEFKDLVIDAVDPVALGRWWSSRLNLEFEALSDGDALLRGTRPEQAIWINAVPESQAVKHRVHLDLHAHDLTAFGGVSRLSEDDEFPWTVYADSEGGEFCVFVNPGRPVGLKDVVVDATDHAAIASWWQDIWGGTLGTDDDYTYLDDIPGAPVESFDFVPVPEPKTVKNRVHWDDEFPWTVYADSEGGEFCVFVNPGRPVGLKDVVVDATDHAAIASWWQDIWGGTLGTDDDYTYLDDIPGAPVESFDFVPVPEPKTVKNRVHWDVWLRPGATVDDLVVRGACVLRPRGGDLEWTVMADPEGNEFCVFERR